MTVVEDRPATSYAGRRAGTARTPQGSSPQRRARPSTPDVGAPTSAALAIELPASPARPARRERHLRSVEPTRRRRRRRGPAVPVLVATGIVIVALFALAFMHALLINGQLRLDEARRQIEIEAEEVRVRQLEVAQLEAPDRVLDAARDRLGMVVPDEVGYLLPVGVDSAVDEPVRVAPATVPPTTAAPAPAPPSTDDASSGTDTGTDTGTDANGDGDADAREVADATTSTPPTPDAVDDSPESTEQTTDGEITSTGPDSASEGGRN